MRVTKVVLLALCVIDVIANFRKEGSERIFDIRKTNERKNESSTVGDCIRSLFDIQRTAFLRKNCCLTKLCPFKNRGEGRKIHELLKAVCIRAILEKERAAGCQSISFTLEAPNSHAQAPTSRTRDKKIRLENITKISARISGLQFLDVPKGDEMRIHNLRLEEEYLLFEVFSTLMGYLQPSRFPTDLVRDAVHKQVPVHLLLFQLLKTEFATSGWILFWVVVTLSIPFITLTYFCCSQGNLRDDASEISMDFRDRCVERTLGVILLFFLTLQVFPIIFLFAGNEQISRQMSRSLNTTKVVFQDLETFSRNTHMQMSFIATSSTDITIEAIRKDLEDIEGLLGRPFQEDLIRETGIDIALDGLDELRTGSEEVTFLVTQLMDDCEVVNTQRNLMQEQLREVSRQLNIARQQCKARDRALCYTLQYTGLEVAFSCGNLTADSRIKQLERMQKEKNLDRNLGKARAIFRQVPQRVSRETASYVAEIKNVLTRKRTEVYKSAHSLDELSRSLSNSINSLQKTAVHVVETLNRWELWRWLSVLGISTMVSLVWGLLLCGAPCGCGATSRTVPFLLSALVLGSLVCLIVCSLGTIGFFLGAHGQSLMCQPLYDEPHYKALGEILDSGGILHKEGGVFKAFLKANDSLKVADVLKSCQLDQPAYTTFHLQNFFDANILTNYQTWEDLKSTLNFTIDDPVLEILSPSLQLNLQFLATTSTLNLTQYRTKISGSLTKKDLSSFADQLSTVARQLNDPVSSKRFDDLALMVRKIIHNETARLAELQDRILYKITALDLLIHPLCQHANQSLVHFKDVQLFLDNHGREMAQRSTLRFTSRLENYLSDLHQHITTKVTKDVGRCRPLWDIFHTMRFFICKLIVDPTNGISVSCFALTLLFLGIVIVVLNLVEHYRELNEELLTSITHRRARDGLIIDNESTWATPPSESPPELERNGQSEPATWLTPSSRQSVERLIPPPPRIPPSSSASRLRSPKRLSTIASRIAATRIPQIPSVSRARSPKRRHESLRLIEPICWKSGSLSPKSWL